MRTILRFRPSPWMAVALAALLVAAGGVAFATIPDERGTIHGCYDKNGDLRVVESASGCRRNETAIEWNQEGPPGPPGETGVRKIGPLFLSEGESDMLFQAGALSFTARCLTSAHGQAAEIVPSTTEDNALFTLEAGRSANYDIDRGEIWVAIRVEESAGLPPGTSQSQFLSYQFNAQAPDGTSVSGVLALGAGVLERPDQCAFAGHVGV